MITILYKIYMKEFMCETPQGSYLVIVRDFREQTLLRHGFITEVACCL